MGPARTSHAGRPAAPARCPGSALTTTGRRGTGRRAWRRRTWRRTRRRRGAARARGPARRRRRPRTRWSRRCRGRPRSRRAARTARRGPRARARPATSPASAGARCPCGAGRGQRRELLGAHLGGSAAEAPVDGLQVGGDREVDGRRSCHVFQSPSRGLRFTGQGGDLDGISTPSGWACQDVRDRSTRGVRDDGYAGPARGARAPGGRADSATQALLGRRVLP